MKALINYWSNGIHIYDFIMDPLFSYKRRHSRIIWWQSTYQFVCSFKICLLFIIEANWLHFHRHCFTSFGIVKMVVQYCFSFTLILCYHLYDVWSSWHWLDIDRHGILLQIINTQDNHKWSISSRMFWCHTQCRALVRGKINCKQTVEIAVENLMVVHRIQLNFFFVNKKG